MGLESTLKNTVQKLVGRVKEATGSAVGNDSLQAEGKTDQFKATVKGNVTKTVDHVKDTVHDGKRAVENKVDDHT